MVSHPLGKGSGLCDITDQEAQALCDVLLTHPFIGASLINSEGQFFWANARAKLLYLGKADVDVTGKKLTDFFPEVWCRERIHLMQELNETGRPAVLKHIRRGQGLMVTYHQMPTPDDEPQRYLVMIAETDGDDEMPIPPNYIRFQTGLMNLGPLDTLSRRELEVLALISQGMTTEQIAKDISRSVKTIEAHRSSIARKLGVNNRVQLADIARRAALEIHHAELERVPNTP